MGDLVLVDRPEAHVALLTLNRPERLNAMSIDLVIELYDTLEAIGDDNTVRVIVLTGAGRAFCSGLDLKDYGIVPNIDGLSVGRIAQRSMRYYSRIISQMRLLRQPVIAAVNGPAYGGGMCLAAGCDVRFGSGAATFNATGIVNGLTATEMGISFLLPASSARPRPTTCSSPAGSSTPTRRTASVSSPASPTMSWLRRSRPRRA